MATVADVQRRLNALGYVYHGEPLKVDNKRGPITISAIKTFQKLNGLVPDGIVGANTFRKLFPEVVAPKKPVRGKMLTTAQIMSKYGNPGPSNLVTIKLPYTMRIAWDLDYITNQIQCHKLIAPNLLKVFQELLAAYGLPELQRLGIDLYGGCYNFRKMRGGNEWSRHAWGIAIDLDPSRNQLKQSKKTAQFAKPEYKKMIDIFYKNGFKGLGPEQDRDWMHFEIAS